MLNKQRRRKIANNLCPFMTEICVVAFILLSTTDFTQLNPDGRFQLKLFRTKHSKTSKGKKEGGKKPHQSCGEKEKRFGAKPPRNFLSSPCAAMSSGGVSAARAACAAICAAELCYGALGAAIVAAGVPPRLPPWPPALLAFVSGSLLAVALAKREAAFCLVW